MLRETVEAGALLGERFRIESELGRGGMATVYRANDEALGRTVALKLFNGEPADSEEDLRRREEVQLLASLNHPGLVTLFDASTRGDEEAFLVMELIEGEDLRRRLDRGSLTESEVALLGREVADALAYIHSRGVIHRDIKPGNILLPDRGTDNSGPSAKLADFGIARIIDSAHLTATGMIVGTAGYFSPEQAIGEKLTPVSDIYSLGLVFLEAITGRRAFPGTAAESMAARLTRDPEIDADVSPAWATLIRRMTNRDPHARPTAAQVSAELTALATQTAGFPTSPAPAFDPDFVDTVEEAVDLSPTKRYPAMPAPDTSEATAREATDGERTARGATRPASRPERPVRWRPIAIVVAALLLVGVAVALVSGALGGANETGTPDAPAYPAVEGELGVHLEQLQRSVTP
jgi:eukaryotic-like serine/threonine-protein kinase